MMGHSHAATGAAAWVAITAPAVGLEWIDLSTSEVIAGAVVTAGAALLPDADHHSGTIAHSLPPISKWVTRWVGKVSGGHRHATHSLLGVAIFGLLALGLSFLRIPMGVEEFQLGAWLMILLLVAFAAKALRLTRGWASSWGVSLAAATLTTYSAPETTWWLPVAVVLGSLVHILGDMVTVEGCPLLWPMRPKPAVETALWKRNGHFALPVLGHAGSKREWVFILAVDAFIVYVVGISAMEQATAVMASL